MKHLYMKYFAAALLAFFVIVPFSRSQVKQNSAQQSNALLWEISGNGLKKPSYLFGTYHLLTNKFLDSLPVILNKFNAADALVCEAAFDDAAMKELNDAMVLQGTTLQNVMKPDDYKLLSDKIQQMLGIGMEPFQTYKPMTMLLLMYQFVVQQSQTAGGDAETGMDLHLQNVAAKNKKDIITLEDTKTQVAALYGQFSLERQSEMLVEFLESMDKYGNEVLESVQCYKNQELNCLNKMVYGSNYKDDEVYNLLDKRNLEWMKYLPQLITKQSCFIAVGAGHLVGENGLVALLQKQGYTVQPVKLF